MPYLIKRRIGAPSRRKECDQRRNNKYNHYYQNSKWKAIRAWFMSLNQLCADCAIEGRSVPAEECHHRFPFTWWDTEEDRMKALLYYDWYVPLCRKCHEKRHKYLKRPENFEQTTEYKLIHELN